ncbi:MAG: peptidoglycan-binding protein, partial [Mesorhizobium sp.]
IVDRLGSLETGEATEAASEFTQPAAPVRARAARASKITVQDAPSMDIDQPLPLTGDMADLDSRANAIMRNEPDPRTPAEAAAAAAMAALGSDTVTEKSEQPGGRKSILGGLARAFKGKKEADVPPLAGSAPDVE